MTDDHETVDNTFYDQNKDNITFMKIFKIFKKLEIEILHTLQFNKEIFDYIEDSKNNTIYIMNNNNLLMDDKIIKKYEIYKKIKEYKNIIFLERKVFISKKTSLLIQIIYQEKDKLINNDNFYNMINKLNKNKNIYILSGDEHYIASFDIYKDKNKICNIKNIGAINTCVYIQYVNLFLTTTKYYSENKEIIKKNGFININYKNNKLIIKEIINPKTNIIFNTINTVYSGLKFLYYRNILKYL
jgi:hypothetical protein